MRPLIDGVPAFRHICETIECAKSSVWVTVAFMWDSFEMPDGRGSALEVLERAAQRGLDVRVIFWRPDEETASHRKNAFWGAPEHFALLRDRFPGISIRWDRAHPGFCQHQKTWIIDAGTNQSTAVVGGINLNPNSMAVPGHVGEIRNHDVHAAMSGPSVADVHHNFVQRWNEASERDAPDGTWGPRGRDDLPFPATIPESQERATVQVQRTTHAGRYRNNAPAPGFRSSDIAAGERTIFDQYISGIRSARHGIYIENQYLEVGEIVDELKAALERGAEVVAVLPADPMLAPNAYEASDRRRFHEARSALARFENFTLAGIAGTTERGERAPVYVHSKLIIVDDEWMSVGSCNLHRYSLFGNGELNAAVWCAETAVEFRTALFSEHLGMNTKTLGCREALRLFRAVARENRDKLEKRDAGWSGIAYSLDVRRYGLSTAP
jgi:cardiolipin synthase A/B